jgi:hypothetical protein
MLDRDRLPLDLGEGGPQTGDDRVQLVAPGLGPLAQQRVQGLGVGGDTVPVRSLVGRPPEQRAGGGGGGVDHSQSRRGIASAAIRATFVEQWAQVGGQGTPSLLIVCATVPSVTPQRAHVIWPWT